jgi:hypothetical protein
MFTLLSNRFAEELNFRQLLVRRNGYTTPVVLDWKVEVSAIRLGVNRGSRQRLGLVTAPAGMTSGAAEIQEADCHARELRSSQPSLLSLQLDGERVPL